MFVVGNEWLTFALLLLACWAAVFVARPRVRREMLLMSLFTMPFGLLEPLFVPAYWHPPSLFSLNAATGFDLESLVFCFSGGGIVAVVYEAAFGLKHKRMSEAEIARASRIPNWLVLAVPLAVFALLTAFSAANPIYSGMFAMLSGGALTLARRPDLARAVLFGAVLFTSFYTCYFLLFELSYPGIVARVWNLPALSGILVLGIPAEEIVFAFAQGTMWSALYEQALCLKFSR
jgi:hypothetical protein